MEKYGGARPSLYIIRCDSCYSNTCSGRAAAGSNSPARPELLLLDMTLFNFCGNINPIAEKSIFKFKWNGYNLNPG